MTWRNPPNPEPPTALHRVELNLIEPAFLQGLGAIVKSRINIT